MYGANADRYASFLPCSRQGNWFDGLNGQAFVKSLSENALSHSQGSVMALQHPEKNTEEKNEPPFFPIWS